jgi:hypothetical protein
MAKILTDVTCYVQTDAAGVPQGDVVWKYTVVDGDIRKDTTLTDSSPTFSKTYHNTGAVGEFWRDGIDAIKTAEGGGF